MRKDKEARAEYFRQRRQERMNYLRKIRIEKGRCEQCGWSEHPEILNFHHVDPSTKEFGFSGSEVGNLSMERLQKEIDKCILLCPNCHQWLHFQETAKVMDD